MLGAWWQVLAAIGVGVVAAAVAFWGIQSQRAISRRAKTLEYLAGVDSDRDIIAARKIFLVEAVKPEGLTPWADPGHEDSPQCDAIRLILNEFELASIGIQFGIIDRDFYRRYNQGTVLRYWYSAAPFVYSLRRQLQSKTVYHEFEELFRHFHRPPKRKFSFLKFR